MTAPTDPDTSAPRRPLRPLPEVLRARDAGENPDVIERTNRIRRHNADRDRLRARAEGRLIVMALFFVALFGTIGLRMGQLATSEPSEPRVTLFQAPITSARAEIHDRNGNVLATLLQTQALYAHPQEMTDIPAAVDALIDIFPDMDRDRLLARLSREGAKFAWLRRTLSPEEVQAVHNIGEPGLYFADRDMRLYPNGRLAAHVLGGASFGQEGVRASEVIGTAGLEKALDARLRDPEQVGTPLKLSIDLPVQSAVRKILAGGMALFDAKGASAVVMDVTNGEIVSLVSLPDFDPNHRPPAPTQGDAGDSPLFNRAVLGVYELGSVFKIFTVAQAMELGLASPATLINTEGPMRQGRHRIRDFRDYGPTLSVTDVIVKSSNIGTARLALQIGADRQRAFLDKFGFLTPTPLELIEAPTGRPLLPRNWGDIETMTISYGHGLSTSPVHLAAGYAALVNGGFQVTPTLLRQDGPRLGPRLVSAETSQAATEMLRAVVTRGTASMAEVPGYHVGGKTGTADKPKRGGGYHRDRVLATFASMFPAYDPRYVVIVTLDEAEMREGGQPRRTAGWTAVPVTAEMITRIAPLLGMRPSVEEPIEPAIREARGN